VGIDVLEPAMKNARKFILDRGGIEKAQMMTRYKLAIWGQFEWQLTNYVPLFLFKNHFPYSLTYLKGNHNDTQTMSRSGSTRISSV
jgi:squalene-hopene/tetraprenyl-beta-curcumene cyclase